MGEKMVQGFKKMASELILLLVVVFVVLGIKACMGFKGKHMTVQELQKIWKGKPSSAEEILVDVREPGEFSAGHVPGAVNIPLGQVASKADSFKAFKTIYVVCLSGGRSANACNMLSKTLSQETTLINIEGGTSAWMNAGFGVEK